MSGILCGAQLLKKYFTDGTELIGIMCVPRGLLVNTTADSSVS